MGSKHFRSLVLGAATAALFASSTPSEAVSIPFFGKSSVCKEDKERLGHDQRILRDRQQLAFDQCRAGAGGEKSQRCQDLKAQQKSEMRRFQDQRKRSLDDCKQRAANPNSTNSKSADATKGTSSTKSTSSAKSSSKSTKTTKSDKQK